MTREETRLRIRCGWRTILSADLQQAGRSVNHEASYICPLCGHGSNGDGLTYNPRGKEGALKCFGCGFSGDVIDLWQRWKGLDYNAALKALADKIEITIDPYKPTAPQERTKATASANTLPDEQRLRNGPTEATGGTDYTEYYKLCRRRLTDPRAAAYLTGRGISIETAAAYWIGFDPEASPAKAPGAMGNEVRPYATPRIIIPCTKGFYVGRSIDPTTPKAYTKQNSPGTGDLFNGKALYTKTPEVFVTEGAFDALAIIEAGGSAISLNSVSNGPSFIGRMKTHPTDAALILCLDGDQPGRMATAQIMEGLKDTGLTVIDAGAEINGTHNDPNEAFTADPAGFAKAVGKFRRRGNASACGNFSIR